MTEPRGSSRPTPWPALFAGVVGGAAAGAADGLATLLRGVGGVSGMNSIRLMMIAVGLGAVAGAVLTMLARAIMAVGERALRPARAAMVAAVVLGAPLLVYDAFALFSGARAATIPGHTAISVLLALVGSAVLAGLAPVFVRLLAREGRKLFVVGALMVLAGGCYWANRNVLPRLYPWFHATLAVLFLVAALVAARLLVGAGPHSRRLGPRGWALSALAGAAVLLGVEIPSLAYSPIIRYAAHERTQLTGLLLRGMPVYRARPSPIPRAPGREPEVPEEPLPEGPHLANADVVLITVDALRADHVGAYGYRRPTTPNIDALARRGVRFERAYTQAPHTSFSVASMLTGKYYPTIARLAPSDAHDPITMVLRRYGWKTAAFFPPAVFVVDAQKLKAYQDNNFGFEYVKTGDYVDAFERLDQIHEFFKSDRPGKVFLWLHLFEPHEPYEARKGHDFGTHDVDRYDSEIAYTDVAVGKLVAYLQRNRPGAIIILTADHGEEFDEHGGRYHGTTLHEEQVRVPLIVVVPGVKPHVISGPVELIDLAPTILGLVDIPAPARIRGTDLGPWLGTPPAPESRLPPAFAEVADDRMIAWGMDKLICKMNWGYCALYDLRADPGEKKNIAEASPERVARLKQRLDDWLDDHIRFEPHLVRGPANPDGSPVPKAIERGRLGDLMVMTDLAGMLQSNAALPVRREAARLLVTLPARAETRTQVLAAMSADDEEVRDWSTVAAARLRDPGAQARLKELLARPEAVGVALREQAALALARASDPAGVPVLAEALNDCQDRVLYCQLIILELGKLRDRRAVPTLLRQLPDWQNRRERVEALGLIGDPSVTSAMIERLEKDEYVPVRVEAARALGRLGGRQAEEALERSLRQESESAVQAAAREALTALRRPPTPPAPTSPPAPRRDRPHSPRRAAGQ